MKDVSCRAIRTFTRKAELLGIDTGILLSDLGFNREFLLNRFHYVDWTTFDRFTRNLEKLTGGQQAMMELCVAGKSGPVAQRLAELLGWMVSPRLLYWFVGSAILPMNYPCLNIEFRNINDGFVQFQMRGPGGDCRPAFHLGVGCLRVASRWIGNSDAEVETEIDDCEAVYTVKLPPNRTFFARLSRSLSILFSGRIAVEILSKQAAELKVDYFRLERLRQQLERRVATATHEEQKRIAAELQIQLGGKLHDLSNRFESMKNRLAQRSPSGTAEAAGVYEQLREAIVMTEDLASGLDPITLHGGSLKQALKHLARQTRKHCRISCEFHEIGSGFEFDHASAVNLYRLAQEAIHNAIKHGKARRIQILMASADDVVALTVTDDGNGIKQLPKHHDGRGAKIMQYRAAMVGGDLRLESERGRSTSVSCVVKRLRDPEPGPEGTVCRDPSHLATPSCLHGVR